VGLYAEVVSVAGKKQQPFTIKMVHASIYYYARVRCAAEPGAGTVNGIWLELERTVYVFNTDEEPFFGYIEKAYKNVRIESGQCQKIDELTCDALSPVDQQSNINTPLEFTLSAETTSFGDYDGRFYGSLQGPYEDLLDSVSNAGFSATFRITSRRSCVSAPCSCSAAAGTEWTFSNGTRSKTFTHGTDDVEWGGAPFYWSWDGVGYLVLEIFDPADYVPGLGGLVIERHTVQITCDTVDDVSTWMASVFSQCIQYDNVPQITHETYDEWAGVFECVPGCEDEHRAAGDHVLDGELVDVEYLGRSTAVGTTECTPPPRISISVKQIATC
jgi:hypothetical protein